MTNNRNRMMTRTSHCCWTQQHLPNCLCRY